MISLESKIKGEIVNAIKERNEVKKNILRLVVGEVQTVNNRSGTRSKPVDDEMDRRYINVMKKIMASNTETLTKLPTGDLRIMGLNCENAILTSFLPASPTNDEMLSYLSEITQQLKDQKSDGQAVGLSMKYLRAKGIVTSGDVVLNIVRTIRS